MSQRIPPYLTAVTLDRRARRRRRVARQVLRAVLFPVLVLRALLAWLCSPCFLD